MNRHNILHRTLTAALAASAIAATPALAKPADVVPRSADARTSSLAGTTSPRQDLRMPDRQSPARPEIQSGQATGPATPEPLTKPVVAAEAPTDGGGGGESVWLVLGIGLAGAGVVAGSAAGIARRSKLRASRVAV